MPEQAHQEERHALFVACPCLLRIYDGPGRELAEGSSWHNWFKNAEFRSVRDKARAGQ
ncbi:hypothetical protein [Sphingomonas pokkalii]|uniref:hypothetical protein n=1 Tax=Sphingomonas pokkalii TaxID=2175090 RepID=UPI00140402C7|nr:hypothetical protein [Sphingomonas pokkalii]